MCARVCASSVLLSPIFFLSYLFIYFVLSLKFRMKNIAPFRKIFKLSLMAHLAKTKTGHVISHTKLRLSLRTPHRSVVNPCLSHKAHPIRSFCHLEPPGLSRKAERRKIGRSCRCLTLIFGGDGTDFYFYYGAFLSVGTHHPKNG